VTKRNTIVLALAYARLNQPENARLELAADREPIKKAAGRAGKNCGFRPGFHRQLARLGHRVFSAARSRKVGEIGLFRRQIFSFAFFSVQLQRVGVGYSKSFAWGKNK
jgi:hypothetical protein